MIWAEGPRERSGAPGRAAAAGQTRAPAHPFALSVGELRGTLRGLAFDGPAQPAGAVVWLPTVEDAGGRAGEARRGGLVGLAPVGARSAAASAAEGAARLLPWRVVGLAIPLATAVEWLPHVLRADGRRDDVALGPDVRFWALAGRWALELLEAGRVVPSVERRPDGDRQAVWRPALGGSDERRRLRGLAEAMPPACRAWTGDVGAVPAAELLEAFLDAAVDALARGWLGGAAWPEARWLLRQDMPAGAGRWLEALGARQSAARLSARRSNGLGDAVFGWTGSAVGAHGRPFRLCLRLSAPVPEGTRGGSAWRLDYGLQAVDDPTVLVPAAAVWRVEAAVARLAGRRVEEPQELLLAELGRAGRICAPVADSLVEARPEGVDLSTEAAYRFLREDLPALEEAGVGVVAPSWWTRRGARRRLGLKLRLRPARAGVGGAAAGGLGVDALVEYDWRVALGDEEISREEFERLAAQKAPLVQLRGEWIELRPEEVDGAERFWRGRPPRGELTAGQALRLGLGGEATGLPLVSVEAEGWLEELLASVPDQLGELPEPPGFAGELRPYQRRGLAWLNFMRAHGLGACLADDMGLGKTVQTIGLLLHARAERPTLLVCPTSVLGNWVRELERFGPGLRVLVHHGHERPAEAGFADVVAQHDVVLTTYGLVHRDEARLGAIEWAGVVLDEAQNVKNPGSRSSRAARRLNAGYRLALTGTPVENRLGELWSIMEFLNPGFLGSAEGFKRRFAVPIEREGDGERAEELRRLVGPFVLRRLKTDPTIVRDLPEKLEMKVFTTLTREQATLYEAVVQDMLGKIADVEGTERRGLILATLTRLKQVCNHPAHFQGDGSVLAHRSGKLARLEEMLEELLAAGDQALVFTQFAEWGGRLRTYLQSRLDQEVLYLHGGTPAEERDKLVARFQSPDGPSVFVLSLRAGGVGLNLTRANHVFHYDRWWNPAVETQATDRAYRIGQTRTVEVHTFVTAGTLEERIDALIESKRALADAVIGTGESWLTELSTEELRSLLTLRQAVIADT